MQLAEAIKKEAGVRGVYPGSKVSIPVLTPTLGQVSMWWHTSMLDLVWPMNTGKGFMPTVDREGNEIGEMRNRLVSMVLACEEAQKDLTIPYVLWVDDDVILNSRMAMCQLLSHERDIVSGVYFCKGEIGSMPLIFSGPSSGTMKFRPGETFEAYGWSAGLCLVSLDVYKRMRDELDLGEDKYGQPRWYAKPEFGVDENGALTLGGTEDFVFFENASKLGYRPLIDCTKHAFGWHYDAADKAGYPKPQWEQWVRRQPVVWPAKGEQPEVVWE